MTSTRRVHVSPEGWLDGVVVVGYHGQLGAKQTPARRGAVYADARGHMVEFGSTRATSLGEAPTSGFDIRVDVAREPLAEGELPGIGTRVTPWPARLDSVFVILGPEELRRARLLLDATTSGEPARVAPFVAWLAKSEASSRELTCERVGELVAWYCTPDEGFALWKRIHAVARAELFRAAERGTPTELEAVSFWFSRAGLDDADICLAAAGLERAGSSRWEILLHKGLARRSEKERLDGMTTARRVLPARRVLSEPPASSVPAIDPELRDARAAVRARFVVKAA